MSILKYKEPDMAVSLAMERCRWLIHTYSTNQSWDRLHNLIYSMSWIKLGLVGPWFFKQYMCIYIYIHDYLYIYNIGIGRHIQFLPSSGHFCRVSTDSHSETWIDWDCWTHTKCCGWKSKTPKVRQLHVAVRVKNNSSSRSCQWPSIWQLDRLDVHPTQ